MSTLSKIEIELLEKTIEDHYLSSLKKNNDDDKKTYRELSLIYHPDKCFISGLLNTFDGFWKGKKNQKEIKSVICTKLFQHLQKIHEETSATKNDDFGIEDEDIPEFQRPFTFATPPAGYKPNFKNPSESISATRSELNPNSFYGSVWLCYACGATVNGIQCNIIQGDGIECPCCGFEYRVVI